MQFRSLAGLLRGRSRNTAGNNDATLPALPGGPEASLPGTATLLFTDIADSTAHWERMGRRFQPIKARHDALLRELARAWQGTEWNTTGDGFFFVFPMASQAILFAVAVQQELARDAALARLLAAVPDALPGGLTVRVGLHTGETLPGVDAGADGPNTNLAARICAAGHGGQIVMSQDAWNSAQVNLPRETTCRALGSYRLKGIARDVALLQALSPTLPQTAFPPLNAAPADRLGLPGYLTSFIGRERDVARLLELLSDEEARLVVLVGPGGIGKTRLSVRAAQGAADQFADGVWFVDMETAATPAQMLSRVAARLPLSFADSDQPDNQRIARFLAGKTLLLVLDNLEQIDRPEDALRVLLDAAPTVKCLASSRERVRLSGAQTYTVSPLAVPDETAGEQTDSDLPLLRDVESVRFFVERAQGGDREFDLAPANAASVAALCRQLEGIPLSLELAAAAVVQMTPAEIVQGIKTHLDLLPEGYHDLPERQRSVRASVDWSYSRLLPLEQMFFAQLAVFEGGLTREAARAVSDAVETPDLLHRLTEKSLLKRSVSQDRTRYRLLHTTRLYAGEKLDALADAPAVHERHARFYVQLAQECVAQVRGAGELVALQTLADEADNVQAALRWAWDAGQETLGGDLALSLATFFERRGQHRAARPLIQQALSALARSADTQSPLYAALLRARAGLALDAFDRDSARADAAQLLALSEAQGRPLGMGQARNLLGIAERDEKHFADAALHFRAALACFQELGAEADAAGARNNLGVTLMEDPAGDKAEAARLLHETLALRRTGGDRRGIAEALTNLGNLAEAARDVDAAGRYYAEALATEQERQDTFGIARALSNLGEVAEAQGHMEQAARLYIAGQYLFGRVGSPYQSYTQGLLERLAAQSSALCREQEAAFHATPEKTEGALIAWAISDASRFPQP